MAKINMGNLQEEVKVLIAEIAEIDTGEITLDANFVEDLGMDSMMALEVLASLEKKYKIKIPEDNLTKMVNLGQVVELINQFINKI